MGGVHLGFQLIHRDWYIWTMAWPNLFYLGTLTDYIHMQIVTVGFFWRFPNKIYMLHLKSETVTILHFILG